MAPKGIVVFLLGSLIGTVGALQDGDKIPESWCITYLSTYLAPVSDVVITSGSDKSFELPSSSVDGHSSRTLDPALSTFSQQNSGSSEVLSPSAPPELLETSSLLPFESSVSAEEEGLLDTTPVQSSIETSTFAPTTEPTGSEPEGKPVVFRVVPDSQDIKRGLRKRELGGFVGSQSEDCNDAAVFNLLGGRLLDGNSPVYYGGENFKELRGQQGSLPRGAITTTFADDGGYLRFSSSALPNGEASFCQDAADGQVYLTFTSSPPNCIQIRLFVIGVDQCQDGGSATLTAIESSTLVSVDLPSTQFSSASLTGGVEGFTSTESEIISSISSPGPDVLSPSTAMISIDLFSTSVLESSFDLVPSVMTEPSLRDTSVIGLPSSIPFSEDLSITQPLQTSSVRFSNSSSSSSFRLPTVPTASSKDSPIFAESTSTYISFVIEPSSDRFSLLPETETQSLDPTITPPIFTDFFPTEIPSTQTPVLSDESSFSDPEFETLTTSYEEDTSRSPDTGTTGTSESDTTVNLDADFTTTSEASISTISDTTGSSEPGLTTMSGDSTTISSAPDITTSSVDETTTSSEAELPSRKCDFVLASPTVLFSGGQFWDDAFKEMPLPFEVSLFEESVSNIFVGTNGLITLGSSFGAGDWNNQELPTQNIAPLAVCAYWDDMFIRENEGFEITYEITDGIVTIDWCVLASTGGGQVPNHFTASFFGQNPGLVEFKYYTTEYYGGSTTVGVQNRNAGKFLQYSYNQRDTIPWNSGLLVSTRGESISQFTF